MPKKCTVTIRNTTPNTLNYYGLFVQASDSQKLPLVVPIDGMDSSRLFISSSDAIGLTFDNPALYTFIDGAINSVSMVKSLDLINLTPTTISTVQNVNNEILANTGTGIDCLPSMLYIHSVNFKYSYIMQGRGNSSIFVVSQVNRTMTLQNKAESTYFITGQVKTLSSCILGQYTYVNFTAICTILEYYTNNTWSRGNSILSNINLLQTCISDYLGTLSTLTTDLNQFVSTTLVTYHNSLHNISLQFNNETLYFSKYEATPVSFLNLNITSIGKIMSTFCNFKNPAICITFDGNTKLFNTNLQTDVTCGSGGVPIPVCQPKTTISPITIQYNNETFSFAFFDVINQDLTDLLIVWITTSENHLILSTKTKKFEFYNKKTNRLIDISELVVKLQFSFSPSTINFNFGEQYIVSSMGDSQTMFYKLGDIAQTGSFLSYSLGGGSTKIWYYNDITTNQNRVLAYDEVICNSTTISININTGIAFIKVDPTVWSVPIVGGTQAITVTSNISWVVSSSVSWVIFSIASGTNNGATKLTAAANTTTAIRTAIITFTDGTISATVIVTQAAVQQNKYLTVLPTVWAATSGGTQAITVTSNVSWTVSSNTGWVTSSVSAGLNNGSTILTAQENITTSSRTAIVTFTDGTISATVTVAQGDSGSIEGLSQVLEIPSGKEIIAGVIVNDDSVESVFQVFLTAKVAIKDESTSKAWTEMIDTRPVTSFDIKTFSGGLITSSDNGIGRLAVSRWPNTDQYAWNRDDTSEYKGCPITNSETALYIAIKSGIVKREFITSDIIIQPTPKYSEIPLSISTNSSGSIVAWITKTTNNIYKLRTIKNGIPRIIIETSSSISKPIVLEDGTLTWNQDIDIYVLPSNGTGQYCLLKNS